MEKITKQKVPLLIATADNDSVMDNRMNVNLLKAYDCNIDDANLYDKSGQLERAAAYSERVQLIRTRGGGHFSFIKYSSIINQAVGELLDKAIKLNNVKLEGEVKSKNV